MTYLAEWFKCFAKFLRDEAYVNAILAAIEVTKKHEAWMVEYSDMSTSAKTWMVEQTAKFTDCREGKDGHGDSTIAIKATLDAFYRYKHEVKPEKRGVLTNVEGHLSTLHASQRNNDRAPLHIPDPDQNTSALEKVWFAMEEKEDAYEMSIRDSYSHFQRLEATVQMLTAKCAKLKAWMMVQQQVFNPETGQYGSSSVACTALLDSFNLYETQASLYYVPDKLQTMLTSDGMALHASHPELTESVSELTVLMTATTAMASVYQDRLRATAHEYAMLFAT